MRKQLLGVFIPLLVLALMAAAAETESASPARAALQKLAVTRGADGISLEITARGQVTPKLSSLDSPARLVLDLPNTVMATSQSHVDVSSEGVKGVRVGMDGQKTPTTRVVVDLEKACRYELVPGGDNKFTLKLYTNTVSAKAETKAAPKAPAAKLVMASAPVVSKPAVVVASAPVAEKKPAAVEAKTTASPTDFVFVEPSYKPKDETAAAKPTVEPSVKALEAAAKFADKPASELVAMKPSASLQQGAASQPAVNLAAEQKAQMTQTPATSGPKYTGEPISVNLKDVDLKDFFRLIHEISGLNVVLDPNVHGSLTVVLDDVPWDQALDIVLKNNDLARQLEGNVLRIATVETLKKEADARRAQIESEALAVEKVTITRFLSYAHSKDVVPTIKKFLTQRGDVISDDRTNALIISDIPNVVPTVDRLLTQLDRKTQEVEIEARVVPQHQEEALMRRLVEAELLFQALDEFGIKALCTAILRIDFAACAHLSLRARAEVAALRTGDARGGAGVGPRNLRDHALDRPARRELHHDERHQHDPENRGDHEQDAADDIGGHGAPSVSRPAQEGLGRGRNVMYTHDTAASPRKRSQCSPR